MLQHKIIRSGLIAVLSVWLAACQLIRMPGPETPAIEQPPAETPATPSPSAGEPGAAASAAPSPAAPAEEAAAAVTAAATATPLRQLAEFTPLPAVASLAEQPPYVLQAGSPLALPNFNHPEAGCSWLGVAGQVFDAAGAPVTGLVVQAGGILNGEALFQVTLTGIAANYGAGGYELALADQPVASQDTVWLQVFDINGNPLTQAVYLDTYADCSQNLLLVNFIHSGAAVLKFKFWLPVLER